MDTALIVDVETTGTDPSTDEIIELAVIELSVGGDYIPKVSRMFSWLQQPGKPLADEIVQLTALTDDQLAGQVLDWDSFEKLVASSSMLIAHNARFDRAFLEKHAPFDLSTHHWACSMSHVDWHKKGFKSRSLNYLACDHGFVNPFPHRALFDCATTYKLIAPYFEELVNRSHLREYRIAAYEAPFRTKDILKSAGYHWDAEKRVWQKTVFEDQLQAEREFLGQKIYLGESCHSEELMKG